MNKIYREQEVDLMAFDSSIWPIHQDYDEDLQIFEQFV